MDGNRHTYRRQIFMESMVNDMSEPLEEKHLQLQKRLEQLGWDELKVLLKEMEKSEDYEICKMIQDEIDERVKDVKV